MRKSGFCAFVFGLYMVSAMFASVEGGEKTLITYLDNNMPDVFHSLLRNHAIEYATENNIEMRSENSDFNVEKQYEQVKTAIADGARALIVIPCDVKAIAPMTETAKAAGVPIVYFLLNPFPDDSAPDGAYYVGSKNREAGILQTEYIGEKLKGKGNVGIFIGRPGTEAAVSRTAAVTEVLQEKFPDITVLAQETAFWNRDKAAEITEKWLEWYGDSLDAILANNDEMALGAVRALHAAGRKDVFVGGVDGTPDGLEAIENGSLTVSVLQDARNLGASVTRLAAGLANGDTAESIHWVPFALITRENVGDFKSK